MTAHTLPLATAHKPALGSATGSNVPIHGDDLGGASIVPLHVHGVTCPCPDCTRAHDQAFALVRLAAYLEEEGPSLARLLRLLDFPGARADLAALQALHVEPGGEAEALAAAAVHLERLLEALAETPARAEIVGLVPAQDQALARNVDAAVRWHGARATDILEVVQRALP